MSRPIVTPTHEFDRFIGATHPTGLRPLYLELGRDIFLSRNRDKYRLCRPAFTIRHNLRYLRLVDFNRIEGRSLNEIATVNDWPLAQWHHSLIEQAHPGSCRFIADYSDWNSQACQGDYSYLRYLALFILRGVLFENFVATDPGEWRFVQDRVLPSFAKAVELFGVRPLIVLLLRRETEHDEHWRCHPGSLHSYALELMRAKP